MAQPETVLPRPSLGDERVIVIPDAVSQRVAPALPMPLDASRGWRAFKRAIDLIGSVTGILLLLPAMVVVAMAVVVESRGAAIYVHRRIGRNGRPIGVLKFRTMRRGADGDLAEYVEASPELAEEWQANRKLRKDPRVTRVGRLLRRTSLDELPQLLNVVVGQMSLVGPRPVMLDEIRLFGDDADSILRVRPGLTGLWTVSGRSEVGLRERVSLESRYVREWSLALDLRILIKTIGCIVHGRGAY